MSEDRIPVYLWIEAHIARLNSQAISCYVVNKGAEFGGMVIVKLNGLKQGVRLFNQQRDFESNVLGWDNPLEEEWVEESVADDYIRRALDRDPDLWIVEVEDISASGQNPFDEKTL